MVTVDRLRGENLGCFVPGFDVVWVAVFASGWSRGRWEITRGNGRMTRSNLKHARVHCFRV